MGFLLCQYTPCAAPGGVIVQMACAICTYSMISKATARPACIIPCPYSLPWHSSDMCLLSWLLMQRTRGAAYTPHAPMEHDGMLWMDVS